MKNEEIEHIIKQTLYETSRKYSKRDAAVVLFYALRDKEKDYFEQININSEPINKMSYKEFQDGINYWIN